jgi:hypothetical protein
MRKVRCLSLLLNLDGLDFVFTKAHGPQQLRAKWIFQVQSAKSGLNGDPESGLESVFRETPVTGE